MTTKLTAWEKETVINFNRESNIAQIYTRDASVMKRLDALCEQFPDQYKKIRQSEIDADYECPKNFIRFRKPVARTEEQIAESQARGREQYEKYLKDWKKNHKKEEE